MADIDLFNSINDTYGHGFGDDVLRTIAAAFTECCRMTDIVCRYGGEEFTVLLPATTMTEATEVAERLRSRVESTPFLYRDKPVRVTCSFGVSNLDGRVPPSLIELADEALYLAKNAGRNRVEVILSLEPTRA